MYSTTIAAVIVNILSMVLPHIGVNLGNDSLTTTVQTIVAIVTGIWIWRERVGKGDVTPFGFKK